jgi:hypothetical protein
MSDLKYHIGEDRIEYFNYPFKCSHVVNNKIVLASDIQEMVENFSPPSIRIKQGEFVFISAADKDSLITFCNSNGIPVVKIVDVWSRILDEFLDTEFSEECLQKSYKQLDICGVSRQECNDLRKEVAARMFAYNYTSCLWEWVYLGLYDLLGASIGKLSGEEHRLNDQDFEKFYFKAMDIAFKGVALDSLK